MTSTLDKLSDPQRQIYDLTVEGNTPEQIAKKSGIMLGVVMAQLTRIRNKGIPLPGDANYKEGTIVDSATPATHINPAEAMAKVPTRPIGTGPSSNEAIANELRSGGTALSSEELKQLAENVAGKLDRDIHPMALLGCTIQFVKLCGGRMSAHQVIEDAYSALRAICNGSSTPQPGENAETKPMTMTVEERLKLLEEQNKNLREQLAKNAR